MPPGQHLVADFPVLSAGPTPEPDLQSWSFALEDGDSPVGEWSWAEFNALPQTEVTVDIHCVTTWSKLDTSWRGVTIDTLLEAAGLDRAAGAVRADPLRRRLHHQRAGRRIWSTARRWSRRTTTASRSHPEHGGPARLLVPHLYFWKSAKWVRRLQFIDSEQPGFWEELGYHIYGDPWREQRYAGD